MNLISACKIRGIYPLGPPFCIPVPPAPFHGGLFSAPPRSLAFSTYSLDLPTHRRTTSGDQVPPNEQMPHSISFPWTGAAYCKYFCTIYTYRGNRVTAACDRARNNTNMNTLATATATSPPVYTCPVHCPGSGLCRRS